MDKSDDSEEIADENEENETTNSLTKFSDLQYILNQKPIPQRQFEKFDPFFTLEGFLYSEVLINIRKNHDAFSRHSKKSLIIIKLVQLVYSILIIMLIV